MPLFVTLALGISAITAIRILTLANSQRIPASLRKLVLSSIPFAVAIFFTAFWQSARMPLAFLPPTAAQ